MPDLASSRPVFEEIQADMRQRIASGQWAMGMLLPSRTELAEEYGVARMTMQKAIQPLLDEGLLVAKKRHGTFVAQTLPETPTVTPVLDMPLATDLLDAVADGEAKLGMVGIISAIPKDPKDMPPEEQVYSWDYVAIRALEREISRRMGRTIQHGVHGKDCAEQFVSAMVELQAMGVDAILVVDAYGKLKSRQQGHKLLQQIAVPMIMITEGPVDMPIAHVFYDQVYVGMAATRHLADSGYEHLVYLPFLRDTEWSQKRFLGMQAVAAQRGVAVTEASLSSAAIEQIITSAHDTESDGPFAEELAALLDSYEPGKWALVAPNDVLGLQVARIARDLGYELGQDVGLLGFDDFPASSASGLSSFRPPLEQLAEAAVRILAGNDQEHMATTQVRLCSELIARASTWKRI